MKPLACILAAAVLAGLGAAFAFDAFGAFAMLQNSVLCNIVVFIGFVAAVAITSAALAVFFQRAVARADYNMVHKLEQRLRALESGPQPSPASPPPHGDPVAEPPPS